MLAQNFAQPGLQQMRGGVIAHGGLANVGVDHGVDFLPNARVPHLAVFAGGDFTMT